MSRMLKVATAAAAALLVTAAGAPAVPFSTAPEFPTRASGLSPFGPMCGGTHEAAGGGFNYQDAEVEPYVSVNPDNTQNIVGVWQQDRWTDGGAHGLLHAFSRDGGKTWTPATMQPPFSKCAGGTPANRGDYERASDPWVSFSPNGVAHSIAISFDDSTARNAVIANRSTDGGRTWPTNTVLRPDNPRAAGNSFNDKESITADPGDSDYVYAIWDRLVSPSENSSARAYENGRAYHGPTWFARSTDNGVTWEPAHPIYDPGTQNQTIGNQIVVLPSGTLVDGFELLQTHKNAQGLRGANVAVIRSTDKGETWSQRPVIVAPHPSVGVNDPEPRPCDTRRPTLTCRLVRTGDIIPEIAVDRSNNRDTRGNLYMVWQEQDSSSSFGDDTIKLSRSRDGGLRWDPPVIVHQTPADAYNRQAFTAQVNVRGDGTVAVSYFDMRKDSANDAGLTTNLWMVHSHTGGASFGDEQDLSGAFDMRSAPYARGYFVGDYTGLDHAGNLFTPLWVQSNEPFDAANRTDAFFTATG